MSPFLFPFPRKVRVSGSGALPPGDWIHQDTLTLAGEHISLFIQNLNKKNIFLSARTSGNGPPFLRIRQDHRLPVEGYRLQKEKNFFLLEGGGEPGAYYGLLTLEQFLGPESPEEFFIEDAPYFPRRGVMLDISRCKVPRLDTLKMLIKAFSKLKINSLQLYMEHTFAFSAHKLIWQEASPITLEEVKKIEEYCARHFIELVPNFNSFGHFERWLRYPDYHHLAESPGGFVYEWGETSPWGTTLRPGKETIQFLDTLYSELLPCFSSPFFNCGCDETWELGKGKSRALCKKKGTLTVYKEFLLEIYGLIRKYNKKMMFWGDIILKAPELLDELPREMIPLLWGYEKEHPFEKETSLLEGRSFFVCPGTSSWNSLSGRTENSLGNLKNAAHWGVQRGACGYLITDWGDKGHHQHTPISFPGFTAGGGYAWNPLVPLEESGIIRGMEWAFSLEKGLGKLLPALGHLHDPLPEKRPNETFFNTRLFYLPGDHFIPLELPRESLELCREQLTHLSRTLESLPLETAEGRQIRKELRHTMKMINFSLARAIHQDRNNGLKEQIRTIIDEYSPLWLRRNRPGGLEESIERLRRVERFFS